MPSFTFARGNASKIVSAPLYALGALASLVVRRRPERWVFACGSGVGEGAFSLFRHAAAADPSLKLVWLARDADELARARELGLTAALRSSWRGFRLTLRAGVVVVTHGMGDANRFGMGGAFVVQLWHGVPLKKIQLDSPVTFRSRLVPSSVLRTLYRRQSRAIGVLPAASEISAARLRTAFGVPDDTVVVTGDPRDDAMFGGAADAQAELERITGPLGGSRVLLYAPTWRDGEADPGVPSADEWRAIDAWLEASDSVLLLRPHPHGVGDYAVGAGLSQRIRMLSPGSLRDVTPALPGVDLLVTDYSSIAFDFALAGRPIAFLAPDAQHYAATRGLYEPYEHFTGGSEVASWAELLALLDDPTAVEKLTSHSVSLAETHHAHRDGRNTKRVYEVIRERLGAGGKA